MSIVLKNRVEASEKSAQELEAVTPTHGRATICRDVEALMKQVVQISGDINAHVDQWQDDIAAGRMQYDESAARALFDLYVRLERTALKTAQLGRQMETSGFRPAGKAEFLQTWRNLKAVTSFSMERVAESVAQIQRGQTKSLGEFADELSRDLEP